MDALQPISPPHREPGLIVAFSERGETAGLESPTSVLARRFAETLGLPDLALVRATQVHGVTPRFVTDARQGEVLDAGEGDVLLAQSVGVGLVIQTADCVPILIAGESTIAAVHAGWQGSASAVADTAVFLLGAAREPPHRLRAWAGPSIGPCCYEVGPEVAAQFPESVVSKASDGGFRLDLRAVNRMQLEEAGMAPERIFMDPACTHCGGPRYASYRRDGEYAGRMIALIARLR
ncbi:MAG: polyphenol oxidase family protein [Thermoanaerobaculia bacterium]